MATKIIAGGGIVRNEQNKILFQKRRGKWDLPKGKLDAGETIEQCALREVEEETGLRDIVLGELIGVTSHLYTEKGSNLEKETHWFAMQVSGQQKLVPQLEEDITELQWVGEEEIAEYLSNSFKNIIDIVTKYFDGKKYE